MVNKGCLGQEVGLKAGEVRPGRPAWLGDDVAAQGRMLFFTTMKILKASADLWVSCAKALFMACSMGGVVRVAAVDPGGVGRGEMAVVSVAAAPDG